MNKSISWILLFCILGLMGCGEPTQEQKIEKLIKKLKVKNPCARRISASELGLIGSKDAVPSLIKALQQDQDPEVRVSAAEALGQIGLEDAVPALIKALQDEDIDVRLNAARALERMGKDAVPALVQALQDEDTSVRRDAAKVLGFL